MDPASILEDLNPPQQEAVLHGDGPLLVLAGAGSGKTRVIVRRIAHLVTVREVFPWRVLAVTFTNKAAREMRERLVALLGEPGREAVVSTFHSWAAQVLRREAGHLGYESSFVIYDDGDQLSVARRALGEIQVDSALTPREVLHYIDQQKNHARLPHEVAVRPGDYKGASLHRAYARYQELLRASNALDFGDLLLLLVELFRTNAEVLEKYRRRFRHVMVDEFQDTNPVQYQLLRLLAPPPSNLVVVGDDDQSIYRWRGAEVDNILGFPRDYPGTRVVKLEQNYRSDQSILEAANAVIRQNPRRMEKRLWSQRPRGEPLQLLLARDERGEAQEIASRILALKREGFIPLSQVAVFFRVNAQSRVLEEAFRLARVPYTLVNARSFYERAEIKDASAYLRLMLNPRSDADLLRVINVPARGIGDTTVERLSAFAASRKLSLREALADPAQIPSLNSGAVKRLGGFRALVEKLVEAGKSAPDAATAVERMLEETQLSASYRAEGTAEAVTRAENLEELVSAAQEFDQLRRQVEAAAPPAPVAGELGDTAPPPATPLQAFLEQISLVGEADQEVGEGRVAMMTLHAAKGLEFDAVFIGGMEEGVFPHQRALGDTADPEEMAEERRLCYVGFTRARRRLFVSLAQQRTLFGELRINRPSRFLSDVPKELVRMDRPEELERQQSRSMPMPPAFRRRGGRDRDSYPDDEGPRIDRSYAQTSDLEAVEGDVRGLRVRHESFGLGVIEEVRGTGPTAKLTVRFESVGAKVVYARFVTPA
ncbi:MAG TPA: UvrD-helicase domain-containing protein [Myxococcales bacterium]|nr:UvrD-helicase domain-containing protein [Myxococcales bacterium]